MPRTSNALVIVVVAVLLAALGGATATPVRAVSCGADSPTLVDGGFEAPR